MPAASPPEVRTLSKSRSHQLYLRFNAAQGDLQRDVEVLYEPCLGAETRLHCCWAPLMLIAFLVM